MSDASPPHVTVTTLNACGLRSALRRGLLEWLRAHQPDVLLLQETRCEPLPEAFAELGYHPRWHPAARKGYSGVAILSRRAPDRVTLGLGHPEFDAEGRVLSAHFGPLTVVSAYFPSGSSGPERQAVKERFMAEFLDWSAARLAEGPLLIGGDLNVAHSERDLKNWRANQKNSGFLPHERAWLSDLLALGLRDSHRAQLGEASEYTWWSQRGAAYANDVGWRLDYLLCAGLESRRVWVDRAARLSDHAPVTVELGGPAELTVRLRADESEPAPSPAL